MYYLKDGDKLYSQYTFRSELHAECRLQCAFNFPAMVIFVGHSNFNEILYPTFADLVIFYILIYYRNNMNQDFCFKMH